MHAIGPSFVKSFATPRFGNELKPQQQPEASANTPEVQAASEAPPVVEPEAPQPASDKAKVIITQPIPEEAPQVPRWIQSLNAKWDKLEARMQDYSARAEKGEAGPSKWLENKRAQYEKNTSPRTRSLISMGALFGLIVGLMAILPHPSTPTPRNSKSAELGAPTATQKTPAPKVNSEKQSNTPGLAK